MLDYGGAGGPFQPSLSVESADHRYPGQDPSTKDLLFADCNHVGEVLLCPGTPVGGVGCGGVGWAERSGVGMRAWRHRGGAQPMRG